MTPQPGQRQLMGGMIVKKVSSPEKRHLIFGNHHENKILIIFSLFYMQISSLDSATHT